MGYGGGGGAASFLDLTDTPETYTGQALKLAKVNAGETALSLDLLLSFTDWYAGGAPTSYPWEFEVPVPFEYDYGIFFSPILKNSVGQYYVYVVGCANATFYLYNITTKQWHKLPNLLTSETMNPKRPLALSPNGKKLACQAATDDRIEIFDIEADAWTVSSVAPDLSATTPAIQCLVWADDDTIWCCVRAYVGGSTWTVKFYKYTVSGDSWEQFTNSITPAAHMALGMGISPDGTTLFAGGVGANYYYYAKYVISTDTYSTVNMGSGFYFTSAADRHRLWYHSNSTTTGSHYLDLSDESTHVNTFPENPQRETTSYWGLGAYGLEACIDHSRTSSPRIMSYFGTGSWRLAQKTLTDYNLVVFKKPADGYAISAVDKVNGYYIPVHIFSTLTLPAGTWEFFYPKDGDYTKLKISGSELK